MVIGLVLFQISVSNSILQTVYVVPSTLVCCIVGNYIAQQKLRSKIIYITLAGFLNIFGVIILIMLPRNKGYVSILEHSPDKWETVSVRFQDGTESELTYINDYEGFDPWSEPMHLMVTEWKRQF